MLVLMFHYWHPFSSLGFTHSSGHRSCQPHYSNTQVILCISQLNLPTSPRARPATHLRVRFDQELREEGRRGGNAGGPVQDGVGGARGEGVDVQDVPLGLVLLRHRDHARHQLQRRTTDTRTKQGTLALFDAEDHVDRLLLCVRSQHAVGAKPLPARAQVPQLVGHGS